MIDPYIAVINSYKLIANNIQKYPYIAVIQTDSSSQIHTKIWNNNKWGRWDRERRVHLLEKHLCQAQESQPHQVAEIGTTTCTAPEKISEVKAGKTLIFSGLLKQQYEGINNLKVETLTEPRVLIYMPSNLLHLPSLIPHP
jgi:hypothetical protein